MANRLQGKNAIVTGAGRGIGAAIALGLAAEGAKVLLNAVTRTPEPGHQVAPAEEVAAQIKKNGGTAIVSFDSVTDFAAAEKTVKTCVDTFGRLDILVNCAGVVRDRMIHNMSEEEWDSVLNVHLKGTFNMTRHAAGVMRAQQYGRIVNIGSAAWQGSVGQANYSASKGGITSLTRTVARELGRVGVTCNCVVPMAATRITMNDSVRAKFKRQFEQGEISEQVYEERINMPGPEYIAPVVTYLCTDAAANINGLVVRSAGGIVGIYNEPKIVKIMHKDPKRGLWEIAELEDLFPKILLSEYINPAPRDEKAK
ncbi:MAG: SDR family NAD(P)-dependent oxidoreductase [Chloroflexi bacterium]|nr:SDR family NAD(P)-dependent oxidoreductase [Chloroflexota bacterium]